MRLGFKWPFGRAARDHARVEGFISAKMTEALEIVSLINGLRANEGASVTINSSNPDFSGPQEAIEVIDAWTNWRERRFDGDTLRQCLVDALTAKVASERGDVPPLEVLQPVAPASREPGTLKLHEAVILWLSHPMRISGSFTCEEIAMGIRAATDERLYWVGWRDVTPESVNACMSGISIRCRTKERRLVTDLPPPMKRSAAVPAGPCGSWKTRKWALTSQGMVRASEIEQQLELKVRRG